VVSDERVMAGPRMGGDAIVECLDYQIPVTQLRGAKGDGHINAAKQDTREFNLLTFPKYKYTGIINRHNWVNVSGYKKRHIKTRDGLDY